jgi:RNA polymerase sigma factor (sigma-70 family)
VLPLVSSHRHAAARLARPDPRRYCGSLPSVAQFTWSGSASARPPRMMRCSGSWSGADHGAGQQAGLDYQEALPDDTEIKEQTRFVLEALQTLAPNQRAVMAWTYDGFTPTEIAEHLECEPAAVRKNLQRARENLKRTLRMRREEVI